MQYQLYISKAYSSSVRYLQGLLKLVRAECHYYICMTTVTRMKRLPIRQHIQCIVIFSLHILYTIFKQG